MIEPPLPAEHPLLLELDALHRSLQRHQAEIHVLNAQLRETSLTAAQATSRSKDLAFANSVLQSEIASLRDAHGKKPDQSSQLSHQMTLALRRASDKYTHIESILRERMFELASLRSDFKAARAETDTAVKQVSVLRNQLQDGLQSRRELEHQARLAHEQRNMADLALQDYATLVRALESNNGAAPLTLPEEGLAQGRLGLTRLLSEHTSEVELLHTQIADLQIENDASRQLLSAEIESTAALKAELADAQLLLERTRSDDAGAAKVVARYMQFSQQTTDALQQSLEALRRRHAITVESLEARLVTMSEALEAEYAQNRELHRLQAQYELELAFEKEARRREVALRLACIEDNQLLRESVQRQVHKTRLRIDKLPSDDDANDLRNTISAVLNNLEFLARRDTGRATLAHVESLRQQVHGSLKTRSSAEVATPELTAPLVPLPLASIDVEHRSSGDASTLPPSTPTDEPSTVDQTRVSSSSEDDQHDSLDPMDPGKEAGHDYETDPQISSKIISPLIEKPALAAEESEATPFMVMLEATKGRYSDLSKDFFACHIALRRLLDDCKLREPAPKGVIQTPLQLVLERLDDYNEDARVELEIRLSDEERIAHGFEALLLIPEAHGQEDSWPSLCNEIRNFSSLDFSGYLEIRETFGKKLADIQHDIAMIQSIIYNAPQDGEGSWTEDRSRMSGELSAINPQSNATFGAVFASLTRELSGSMEYGMQQKEMQAQLESLGLKIPVPRFPVGSGRLQMSPSNSPGRGTLTPPMLRAGLGVGPGTVLFARRASTPVVLGRVPSGRDWDVPGGDESDVE